MAQSLFASSNMAPAGGNAVGAMKSGPLTALQSELTYSAAISKMLGGVTSAMTGLQQYDASSINAEFETLAARERAVQIRRELVEKIGQNRVAFAASGQLVAGGEAIEMSLRSQAGDEIARARGDGQVRAINERMRGTAALSGGVGKLLTATSSAKTSLYNHALDVRRRG